MESQDSIPPKLDISPTFPGAAHYFRRWLIGFESFKDLFGSCSDDLSLGLLAKVLSLDNFELMADCESYDGAMRLLEEAFLGPYVCDTQSFDFTWPASSLEDVSAINDNGILEDFGQDDFLESSEGGKSDDLQSEIDTGTSSSSCCPPNSVCSGIRHVEDCLDRDWDNLEEYPVDDDHQSFSGQEYCWDMVNIFGNKSESLSYGDDRQMTESCIHAVDFLWSSEKSCESLDNMAPSSLTSITENDGYRKYDGDDQLQIDMDHRCKGRDSYWKLQEAFPHSNISLWTSE